MTYISYQYWICSAFNRKFYISYGSVLRAAYLKKVFFYMGHHDYLCTYEVAGLGTVEEEINGCSSVDHLDVYESIESFRKGERFGKESDYSSFPGIRISVEHILEKAYKGIASVTKDTNGNYHVYRYKWNGVETENVDIGNSNIWLDEYGYHTDVRVPDGTFPTKEECESSNKISVIEFDD